MDMFQIEGARPLVGTVRISGSKNACLPLLAAAILAPDITVIEEVPDLRDIREMCGLLRHLGAKVVFQNNKLEIDARVISKDSVPYEIMRRMRASFWIMGPMLARLGRAKVSLPGGCAIGDRPVDIHLRGLRGLGVQMAKSAGYVHARVPGGRIHGSRVSLMGPNGTSVGATCNVLMAAVLGDGTTVIDDAAREPEVIELCRFLQSMGAQIEGVGSSTLRIEGVTALHGARWRTSFDRIEAATYAVAALATHGDVTLENVAIEELVSTLNVLEQWGADLSWPTPTSLRVRRGKAVKHPLSVVTEPFPGFPTDAQAQLTVLLALTTGQSSVRDTIYPERFKHVPELNRLGAKIKSPEKGRIEITGVSALEGAAVMASDLRAGAALVIAALAAHGTSQIRRVYHIERGYEKIEEKLTALGASITRLPEDADDPGLEMDIFPENVEATSASFTTPIVPARLVD